VRGVPSGRPAASVVGDEGAVRTFMNIQSFLLHKGGPGEARYGLGGTGIKFRLGRDFPHPSRPALGPTRSFVQWTPGRSRGLSGRGVVVTTHPHAAPRLKKE